MASLKNKEVEFRVNGTRHHTSEKYLTFDEIVAFAFGANPQGGNITYTITYRKGHGNSPEGDIKPGGKVRVKEGMIFNVTKTDKS